MKAALSCPRGSRADARHHRGEGVRELVCETFSLSRAAYYADARRQRGEPVGKVDNVVALPQRPRFTSAEVVLLRIREVLACQEAGVVAAERAAKLAA